jgi:hypothetical protein
LGQAQVSVGGKRYRFRGKTDDCETTRKDARQPGEEMGLRPEQAKPDPFPSLYSVLVRGASG